MCSYAGAKASFASASHTQQRYEATPLQIRHLVLQMQVTRNIDLRLRNLFYAVANHGIADASHTQNQYKIAQCLLNLP